MEFDEVARIILSHTARTCGCHQCHLLREIVEALHQADRADTGGAEVAGEVFIATTGPSAAPW